MCVNVCNNLSLPSLPPSLSLSLPLFLPPSLSLQVGTANPHLLAEVMKVWLRSLPEPVVTWELREKFLESLREGSDRLLHTFTHTFTHIHSHLHTFTHTFTHTHLHTRSHTHHTHTCISHSHMVSLSLILSLSLSLFSDASVKHLRSPLSPPQSSVHITAFNFSLSDDESDTNTSEGEGEGDGDGEGEGEGESEREVPSTPHTVHSKEQIAQLRRLVSVVPSPNLEVLRFLIGFMNTVVSFEAENKMGSANVAIIFGPLILGAAPKHTKGAIPDVSGPADVVTTLLDHSLEIFGEQCTSVAWVKAYGEKAGDAANT